MKKAVDDFKYFPKELYDDIQHNYMVPIFKEIRLKIAKGRIVDYGCGNGLFGSYFIDGVTQVIGVDASPYALEEAKKRGYSNTQNIDDFSTQPLPLESESIDFVICKDVLEHLLDPDFVCAEIYRILKLNGKALIHVPNHFPIKSRLKFLFDVNIDTQGYFPGSNEWNFPHIRFYTHTGLIKFLTKNKLEVIEDYSYYFASYIPKTARIPLIKDAQEKLAEKYPTHFSSGFCLFITKK